MSSQLDRGYAGYVHGLLEETFGGYWDGFEAYMTTELPWHEWRFGGTLGFGGKLHRSAGRLYVSCYPEHRTDVNDELIARVNKLLAAQSDTAYLICERCAWVLPIMHTDENERCPECEGMLIVADDHALPEAT